MRARPVWDRSLRLGIGMCTLAALFSLPRSSVFALRSVSVSGTVTLSESEIVQATRLRPGTPLLWVDREGVARRVLEIPRVRDVRVELRWPDTIRIRITERIPAVNVRLPDRTLLVDREGIVLGEGSDPALLTLTADGFSAPAIRPGRPIPWASVRAAIRAIGDLPRKIRFRAVRVDPLGPLEVQLASGIWVRVRPEDDLGERLRLAEVVVDRLRRRGIEVVSVDVRFKDRAFVRTLPAGRSP